MSRRSSTIESTGLDYSTALQVEADILCRIRALILSSQVQCPPRESSCSKDNEQFWNSESTTVQGFDFLSVQSVAKAARTETGRLSLPIDSRRLYSRSMNIQDVRRTSEPTPRPIRQQVVQSPSSGGGRRATEQLLSNAATSAATRAVHGSLVREGDQEHGSLQSSSSLKTPANDTESSHQVVWKPAEIVSEQRGFRYPRLVLQDKASPRAALLPKLTLKTTEVSGPRFKVTPIQTKTKASGKNAISSTAKREPSPSGLPTREKVERHLRPSLSHVPGSYRSETVDSSPDQIEIETSPFWTGVPDSHPDRVVDGVRGKPASGRSLAALYEDLPSSQDAAEISLASYLSKGSIEQSPSSLSTTSKTSAHRHALLRPSVSSTQPVDLSLPVSPVTSVATPPASHVSHEEHDRKGVTYHGSHSAIDTSSKFNVITTQVSLPGGTEAMELSKQSIPSPTILPQPSQYSGLPAPDADSSRSGRRSSVASPIHIPLHAQSTEPLLPPQEMSLERRRSYTVRPSDETYGDSVPGVEKSVHDVVQEAVRKAVHDAIAPHRVESSRASAAYRKLVSDAMIKAANATDEYLRRASVWSVLPEKEKKKLSETDASAFEDVPLRSMNNSPICTKRHAPNEKNVENAGERISPPRSETVVAVQGQYTPSQYSLQPVSRSSFAVNNDLMFNLPINLGSYSKLIEQSRGSDEEDRVETQHENQENSQIERPSKSGSWAFSFGSRQNTGQFNAIPIRKSSLNQVHREFSSVSATNHDETSYTVFRSPAQRQVMRHESDRSSSSSASSAKASPTTREIFASAMKLLPKKLQPNQSSDSMTPHKKKESVHWLHELLPNGEPYAPRFTTLPPRIRNRHASSDQRSRSESAPEMPVVNLSLGAEPTHQIQLDHFQASETLERTITDLEELLNEALLIAAEAAEGDGARFFPKLLEDVTSVPERNHAELINNESLGNSIISPTSPVLPRWRIDLALRRNPTERPPSFKSAHESVFSDSTFYTDGISSSDDGVDFFDHIPIQYSERVTAKRDVEVVGLQAPQRSSNSLRGFPTGQESPPYRLESANGSGEPFVSKDPQQPGNNISEVEVLKRGRSATISYHEKLPATAHNMPSRSGSQLQGNSPMPLPVSDKYYKPSVDRIQRRSATLEVAKPFLAPRRGSKTMSTIIMKSPYDEEPEPIIHTKKDPKSLPNKREVREYIRVFHEPPIQSRQSSLKLREATDRVQPIQPQAYQHLSTDKSVPILDFGVSSAVEADPEAKSDSDVYRTVSHHSLDGPPETVIDFGIPAGMRYRATIEPVLSSRPAEGQKFGPLGETPTSGVAGEPDSEILLGDNQLPQRHVSGHRMHRSRFVPNLRGRSHVSLKEHHGFSLTRSHKRQPIARDWSPFRKRWVATIACISTAMIGIIIGIYAGMVPSIQYYIVDFHHYSILGNVFFFIGLAISTLLFWPLPLLHGRKPYILAAMAIAMPLLFPQAVAISSIRSPYVRYWRIGLLLPRALMGLCLGFANANFKSILTDLFGASLQSGNPHQEVVDEFDVRRHGGGMGLWLGIWTWCFIGSIGIGFLIGAVIINSLAPSWGIYISIIIIAAVLFLNILAPETRRSAYRRSLAEVQTKDKEVSRRVARGEVMMHRKGTGPMWWGEEFHQGVVLSINMLRQPGFFIMAVYVAWIYGQVILIIVLLGSLTSKYYRFTSPVVGACISSVPIGALLAVPFQKASLFSRDRHRPQRTDSMTFEKQVTWSSHLVRRSVFTLVLPFAGLAYTLSSGGPDTPFMLPVIFAALIGFLSNLAIAECHGIIMETFDTSDLQPGMTGRPRGSSGDRSSYKRTNYSSFPRVSSAFALTQGFGFLIAAACTGVGGVAQRHLGQKLATGVMAAILLILTILLLGVLVRWKVVQIIPNNKKGEMDQWEKARRASTIRRSITGVEEEEPWRPIIIGNPSGKTRRMSILELGGLSRWSEIRRRNRLVDESGLEAKHPNLAMLGSVGGRMREGLKTSPLGSLRLVPRASGMAPANTTGGGIELVDFGPRGNSSGAGDRKGKGRSRLSKRYDSEDGTQRKD